MALLELAFAALAAATPIEGVWNNPSRSVTIRIAPCAGAALCGIIVAASDKAKADARKGGTKELIGAELLSGFVAKGEERWKARLFVPDLNRTTRADLLLLAPDRLKVKGCAAGGTICRSQVWARASTPAD